MIKEVIEAISRKLDEVADIPIYVDKIPQELQAPCFYIKLLRPTDNVFFDKRYYRTQLFNVHYFPSTEDNSELWDMSDKLMNALEYVELDGEPIRGTSMSSELVDYVLHVSVNYNFFYYKDREPEEYMENLEVEYDTEI